MTPLMLRQLWALVESIQSVVLTNLDDTSLAQLLVREFKAERSLNQSESDVLNTYIHSRLHLIRDLAQQR